MTCYPSERSCLFPWQWSPWVFVQLTDTDAVTQTCRNTSTLVPHQRNCANPQLSTTMKRTRGEGQEERRWFICTFAWCRSTPYMDSFLAFSRNWVSASAGVSPLTTRNENNPAHINFKLLACISTAWIIQWITVPVRLVEFKNLLLHLFVLSGCKG